MHGPSIAMYVDCMSHCYKSFHSVYDVFPRERLFAIHDDVMFTEGNTPH